MLTPTQLRDVQRFCTNLFNHAAEKKASAESVGKMCEGMMERLENANRLQKAVDAKAEKAGVR